jgi:hypothetical protein
MPGTTCREVARVGLTVCVAVLVASGGVGCGGGGGGGGGAGTTAAPSFSAVIDQSGGSLAGPLNSGVVVPPLALGGPVTITAAVGDPIVRAGSNPIGSAVRFGPEGTVFQSPVTITLPFAPSSVPAGQSTSQIIVAKRDESTGSVSVLPVGSVGNETLTFTTISFSTFQGHVPEGPDAPTGLTATAVAFDTVDLSWTDASSNETGFRVERAVLSVGSFSVIGQTAADVATFRDTTASGSTDYVYRVFATNAVGDSAPSNSSTVTTPPDISAPNAPTGLTAQSTLATQVNLAWSDNSSNETGFKIERRVSGGSFVLIATVAAGVAQFADTSVIGGLSFDYRVRATNQGVDSAPSNIATVSTPAIPASPPSGLTATVISSSRVDLSWTDNSSNETGFRIERRVAGGGNFATVASTAANVRIAQDTSVSAQTTYEYRVKALRGSVESEPSSVVAASTPAAGAPAAPTNLAVSAVSRTQMNLTWTDNATNETGYRVERREAGLGAFSTLQTLAANSTAFSDATATSGTAYDYRVFASNASGDSPSSNVALVYSIVYVRYTRKGDTTSVTIPEGENPYMIEPGADLVLLYPDGSEDVLVDCRTFTEPAGNGQVGNSVQDPSISFDGKTVYYSKYVGLHQGVSWHLDTAHCFIFKMRLDVPADQRQEIQLTGLGRGFATDKPGTNTPSDAIPDFGIRDLGPVEAPGGRIVFTSNREALVAFHQGVLPNVSAISASTCSQLYSMLDHDGSRLNRSLRLIGYGSLHQDQHPIVLKDGRILFTHWDDAGIRVTYGATTLYTCDLEGGNLNQFLEPHNFHKRVDHFITQLSSGPVIVSNYYPDVAMWGFGTLIRHPVDGLPPLFREGTNTAEDDFRFFSRLGTTHLTTHTHGEHFESPNHSGRYSMPSALPGDAFLVAYSPGPVVKGSPAANDVEFPVLDSGIYAFDGNAAAERITSPTQLRQVLNKPEFNEFWPRPVLPYARIYGVAQPPSTFPDNGLGPTERDRGMVPAIPMGLVGTSSIQNRESAHVGSNDFFNPANSSRESGQAWIVQGTDAGVVTPDDIFGVRVVVAVPDRYHAPFVTSQAEKDNKLIADSRFGRIVKGYYTHSEEKWLILGEFPARNSGGVIDPDGQPDTSFLARVPANTPLFFQAIDSRGLTVSTEQTWRHVRSGATVADCGGCHAHSVPGIPFKGKFADSPTYSAVDLVRTSPQISSDANGAGTVQTRTQTAAWGFEFRRDVYPILTAKCGDCHFGSPPPNGALLSMFDVQPVPGSSPSGITQAARTYNALANDSTGQFTSGQSIPGTRSTYVTPQESRYVRALQARQSYLVWKLWGARLDGRTNSSFPLPNQPSTADLDFVQANCLAAARTTPTERGTISRWIDLGCPIDLDRPRSRYTDDTLIPVLTLRLFNSGGQVQVRVGALDIESGIDASSMRVELTPSGGSTTVLGAGGTPIALDPDTGVATVATSIPVSGISVSTPLSVTATVRDLAGNLERIESTVDSAPPAAP